MRTSRKRVALDNREDDPFQLDVKKLKWEWDVYRIGGGIGDFRVLYRVIPEDDVILVFGVDKRSKVYGRCKEVKISADPQSPPQVQSTQQSQATQDR